MDVTTPESASRGAAVRPTRIERPEGPRLNFGAGSQWQQKGSGDTFTMTSRTRSGGYLRMPGGSVAVSNADLLAEYVWVGRDHTDFCCGIHDEHMMPHRGCIMR